MPSRRRSPAPRACARPPAGRIVSKLEQAFAAAMAHDGGAIAVAVSGGGDSVALMHLLAGFSRAKKLPPPVVLTVDHGLRKGSGRDARQVVAWAKAAGLKAHILVWRGAKPKSGLEAAARAARYRLMGKWLVKHRLTTLHLGHTRDDQAETFLLRLARGSGLDGLSAMRPLSPWPLEGFPTLRVARPLLETGRADLRAYLARSGQAWLEDPMNDDAGFDRVKMRKARAALEEAGLPAPRIAAAAAHLSRARAALEVVTEAVLARATHSVSEGAGRDALLLDPVALTAAPREISLRALAAILGTVSGKAYRPRFESLERLLDRIGTRPFRGATLQGCHILAAASDQRHFGAATLAVRREGPRKSPAKTGSSAASAARKR